MQPLNKVTLWTLLLVVCFGLTALSNGYTQTNSFEAIPPIQDLMAYSNRTIEEKEISQEDLRQVLCAYDAMLQLGNVEIVAQSDAEACMKKGCLWVTCGGYPRPWCCCSASCPACR